MEKETPLGQDVFDRKRVEDCRRLFIQFNGTDFRAIERAMHKLGHASFSRRLLYGYRRGGKFYGGWIERHGFDRSLEEAALSVPPPKRRITSARAFACFQDWLKAVRPNMQWDLRHQMPIFKKLQMLEEGAIKRLMIFMPPRHGKSEMVTVGFASWLLREDPSRNVIIGSYNQRLANRFSRKIKRTLVDDWYLHGNEADDEDAGERLDRKRPACIAADAADGGAGESTRKTLSTAGNHAGGTGVCKRDACGPVAYPNGSPFPFASKRRANTDAEWETSHGGGLRAVGVGSGVTGFGADYVFVDDPIKSRAEAESPTYRRRVWEWFNDDLFTRLEPNGKTVLIQTRWHEDDLAGRLLREAAEASGNDWAIVDLPALAEGLDRKRPACQAADAADGDTIETPHKALTTPGHHAGGTGVGKRDACGPVENGPVEDQLGRSPGEALWPERYDEETLSRIRTQLGSYSFASLYQQKPVPAEGGLFKREWFRIVARAPEGLRWKRATDPGITSTASSDYTASFRIAFDRENNLYIDGGYRKQVEYPELRRFILSRMREERDTVEHCIERSGHGFALIQDLARERSVRGQPLRGVEVRDGKIARALGWIALAEQGKVFLTRGGWNRDFIDECTAFPAGTHDDQVDAVSVGVKATQRRGGGFWTFA